MTTGFIGLGHLGRAIAQRLIDCRENLVVYNRTRAKAEGLRTRIAESVAEVTIECDTTMLCLFDSAAVSEVLAAVPETKNHSKLIIDLSTNHPRQVIDFHTICKQRGYGYLEAPVLGSVIPASRGELTMLVSGEEASYLQAKSLLEKIAKTIHYLGQPGLATKMKLINNFVLGSFMVTLAEAISFGEQAGMSREKVIEILGTGAGNSGVLNAKKEKLIKEDFSPHFSSSAIYKDLGYLQDLLEDLDRNPELAELILTRYQDVVDAGFGELDLSRVIKQRL